MKKTTVIKKRKKEKEHKLGNDNIYVKRHKMVKMALPQQ